MYLSGFCYSSEKKNLRETCANRPLLAGEHRDDELAILYNHAIICNKIIRKVRVVYMC